MTRESFWKGASVGALVMLLLFVATACALWQLGTPPKGVTPRECVGTYVHPDSTGHCVPAQDGR